ncbi:T6SS effector BTH_I2691 family protein [Salinicola avicenniae]|uniref:T6SS effector BTH_I2691 family protein n=1 Tax=Salinicola avicenniae TaxID=2916836 RepID=UPI002072F22D|nr:MULTISPECIES: T6SS effector BTH_I2691 family protein [unclassified Salinicola]
MSSADSPRPDCSFCGGGGLPILPVRYAVARSDDVSLTAPELPADLADDAVSQVALSGGQHYTLRLLREGFLYVFNAARGRWQGYYVTDEGFLSRYIDVTNAELLALDPNAPGPLDADIHASVEDDEFPCRGNPEHVYPGRCITIPTAQDATELYLAFSDDRWTKRVWKAHAANTDGRRDAMRRLSLTQWKSGSADYTRPLNELGERVAEANFPWVQRQPSDTESGEAPQSTEVSALSHSLAPVNGIRDDVDGLIEWSQRQATSSEMTPALFVLDDPAGVTSDLAALLEAREHEFNEQEAIKRPFVTAGVINALRDGLRERARMQRANKIVEERLEHEYYRTYGGPPGMSHELKANFERRQQEDPVYRQEVEATRSAAYQGISEAELEEAADDAWDKYGDKLRPDEPDHWMESTYRAQLSVYDKDNMQPLASAYMSWLTGNPLLIYLDNRFDDDSVESGISFVSVISFVLLGTQSYTSAFRQYVQWLSSTDIADDNLLLRALCLNHKELQTSVLAAADQARADSEAQRLDETGDTFRTIPWGPLIASFVGLTKDFPDEMVSPAWLIGRLFGPMMSAVNSERVPRPLLIALGVTSARPVRVFEKRGTTQKQAIPALSNKLRTIYPQLDDVNIKEFERKIRVNTRSLRQMNNSVAGQHDYSFAIRHIELGELSDYDSETRLMNQALTALEPMSEVGGRAGAGEKLAALIANREISAGVLNVFFAVCTFNNYLSGMNRLLDEPIRKQGRLMGAGMAVSGAGLELVGDTLKQAKKTFVTSEQLLGRPSKFLLRLGIRFSLAGGLLLGAMDLWEGGEEWADGELTLSTLHLVSGISTVGASLAIFSIGAGMTGALSIVALWWVAGILGVFAIAATLAIWWFTEDDLQKWLAECAFGKRGNLNLGSAALESELQNLKAITQERD